MSLTLLLLILIALALWIVLVFVVIFLVRGGQVIDNEYYDRKDEDKDD